jgi:hypothetical protein
MPETQTGTMPDSIPGGVLPQLSLGHHNPLFWLLLLFLIWTGYVYGEFGIGIKQIGRTRVEVH